MTATAVLVFARCAGFASKAPGFSHPSTPKYVRIILAAALAIAVAPGVALPAMPFDARLLVAFVREMLIGAAIGVASSVLYDGAYAGGRALDDYLGIRASVPTATIASGSGYGRLWSLAFLAGFFLLGGVEVLVPVFVQTFVSLPVGNIPDRGDLIRYATSVPVLIVTAALTITGPAMAAALLAQIGLATIGRVVPRFSTFALSFPLVFAASLSITLLGAPELLRLAAHPWCVFMLHAHGR